MFKSISNFYQFLTILTSINCLKNLSFFCINRLYTMANLSGLISGFFTDIDVVDSIAINGNVGSANQVLTSDGTKTDYQNPTVPAASALD